MFGDSTTGFLGDFNRNISTFVRNNTPQSAIITPPPVLSYDEAEMKLKHFNNNVVNGSMTLERYFSIFHNNKFLKEYVTTTDQQSQSVQGLMRASQQAHDKQVAQNQAIIQGTLAAKASQTAIKGLALAGNMLAPMLIGSRLRSCQVDRRLNPPI